MEEIKDENVKDSHLFNRIIEIWQGIIDYHQMITTFLIDIKAAYGRTRQSRKGPKAYRILQVVQQFFRNK